MSRRVYTEDEKAEALRVCADSGLGEAVKATGIPKTTIRNWAKAAGIGTGPSPKTEAATEASRIDAAAIRAATSGKTIKAADMIADLIIERIPAEGREIPMKDLTTVFGILADKHTVLVKMDQGNEEHNAVDAWLSHVMGGQ